MTIYPTSQFKRSFKKLPKNIQQLTITKNKIFRENPHAPSLKTHKLKGKLSSFWSYSVKYSYRVVFEFVDDKTVIYHDIGTHAIYN